MVHSVLISNIREMNYIIGNFVFIPSSAANRNDNRTKLCSESVIKINFLTNLKESSRIEESASCNLYLGCQRGFSCAVQVYSFSRGFATRGVGRRPIKKPLVPRVCNLGKRLRITVA